MKYSTAKAIILCLHAISRITSGLKRSKPAKRHTPEHFLLSSCKTHCRSSSANSVSLDSEAYCIVICVQAIFLTQLHTVSSDYCLWRGKQRFFWTQWLHAFPNADPLLSSPHAHKSLCLLLYYCPVNKFFSTIFLEAVYMC